jgi:hypothetical protein
MASAKYIGKNGDSETFLVSSGSRSALLSSLLNFQSENPTGLSEETVENLYLKSLQDEKDTQKTVIPPSDSNELNELNDFDKPNSTEKLHRMMVMSLLDEQPFTLSDLTNSLDISVKEVMVILDQLAQKRYITSVDRPIWEKIFSFGRDTPKQYSLGMPDSGNQFSMPVTLTLKGYWYLHKPIRFGLSRMSRKS